MTISKNYKAIVILSSVLIYAIISFLQMRHVNYLRHYQFAIEKRFTIYPVFPYLVLVLNYIREGFLVTWPILFFFIYCLRHMILTKYLKNKLRYEWALFLPLISVLIYPPFYDVWHPAPYIYVFPNEFRSPTTIFAFPFSILLYVYFIKHIYLINRISFILKVFFFSIIVFLIKPSYIIAFLPAFAIWIVMYSNISKYYKSVLVITSICGLLASALFLNKMRGLGLEFAFFKYWFAMAINNYYMSVIIKLTASLLLPIYVFLRMIEKNEQIPRSMRFSALVFIISLANACLFADTIQLTAGNFFQAMNIPANILFIECMVQVFGGREKIDYFGVFLIVLSVFAGIRFCSGYLQDIMFQIDKILTHAPL